MYYDVVLTFTQSDCESMESKHSLSVLLGAHPACLRLRTMWWCNHYLITSNRVN